MSIRSAREETVRTFKVAVDDSGAQALDQSAAAEGAYAPWTGKVVTWQQMAGELEQAMGLELNVFGGDSGLDGSAEAVEKARTALAAAWKAHAFEMARARAMVEALRAPGVQKTLAAQVYDADLRRCLGKLQLKGRYYPNAKTGAVPWKALAKGATDAQIAGNLATGFECDSWTVRQCHEAILWSEKKAGHFRVEGGEWAATLSGAELVKQVRRVLGIPQAVEATKPAGRGPELKKKTTGGPPVPPPPPPPVPRKTSGKAAGAKAAGAGEGGVCRVCGRTDRDCEDDLEATGEGSYWVEPDLCSACAAEMDAVEADGEKPGKSLSTQPSALSTGPGKAKQSWHQWARSVQQAGGPDLFDQPAGFEAWEELWKQGVKPAAAVQKKLGTPKKGAEKTAGRMPEPPKKTTGGPPVPLPPVPFAASSPLKNEARATAILEHVRDAATGQRTPDALLAKYGNDLDVMIGGKLLATLADKTLDVSEAGRIWLRERGKSERNPALKAVVNLVCDRCGRGFDYDKPPKSRVCGSVDCGGSLWTAEEMAARDVGRAKG